MAGTSISDAAQKVGCDQTSFYVWLKDEHFQAELNRGKSERAQMLRDQIRELVPTTLQCVRDLLTGVDISSRQTESGDDDTAKRLYFSTRKCGQHRS